MRISACGRMMVRNACERRHAERQRRAHLAGPDRGQAGADGLGHVGAEMDAERQHAGGDRAQRMADQERKGEKGPDQERQRRDGAHAVDVEAEHEVEDPAAIGAQTADHDADGESQQQRQRADDRASSTAPAAGTASGRTARRSRSARTDRISVDNGRRPFSSSRRRPGATAGRAIGRRVTVRRAACGDIAPLTMLPRQIPGLPRRPRGDGEETSRPRGSACPFASAALQDADLGVGRPDP